MGTKIWVYMKKKVTQLFFFNIFHYLWLWISIIWSLASSSFSTLLLPLVLCRKERTNALTHCLFFSFVLNNAEDVHIDEVGSSSSAFLLLSLLVSQEKRAMPWFVFFSFPLLRIKHKICFLMKWDLLPSSYPSSDSLLGH